MNTRITVRNIPEHPGVYLMKGEDNQILYIGKAKNLKKRVSSYFRRGLQNGKTENLVRQISSVETFITDNEVEALILESNLIKRYKPRYNIELKENESYPCIKITREPFPRIIKTRTKLDDGAIYFGPYTNASYVNRTIRTITEIFPLRRCSLNLDKKRPSTPCINYYLGKCVCPCCGKISTEEYVKLVDQVVLFLKGQNSKLVSSIKKQMEHEAKNRQYEQAMQSRDRFRAINHLLEEQKMTTGTEEDEDFIGVAKGEDACTVTVLVKRNGKMIGKRDYTVKQEKNLPQVLEQFLPLHYDGVTPAPRAILLPFNIPNLELIELYMKKMYKRAVRIAVPERGAKKRLVNLACRNALQRNLELSSLTDPSIRLERLEKVLHLSAPPRCIEAFDIATTLGNYSVAGMVRFTDGTPDRNHYRKFRIRFTPGQNDVGMIREVVARRYQRMINEKKPLPDMVLVDGGLQQVLGAKSVLKILGINDIPVVGLAKKYEDIYLNGRKKPIRLEKSDPALKLLMSVRNEVHRYANTYHVSIRAKKMIVSQLGKVPGIGDTLVSAILSIISDSSTQVSIEVLKKIRGIGPKKAARVFHALKESGVVPLE